MAELRLIEEIGPGFHQAQRAIAVQQRRDRESPERDGEGFPELRAARPERDERLGEHRSGEGEQRVGHEHQQVLLDEKPEVLIAGQGAELVHHPARGCGEPPQGEAILDGKKCQRLRPAPE